MVNFSNTLQSHKIVSNNHADNHFQHYPANSYEQEILKKEFMHNNNNNHANNINNLILSNNNTTPLTTFNSADHMDVIPALSLHSNRQDSIDLASLPIDQTFVYRSTSKLLENPGNNNNNALGPGNPLRQTSIDMNGGMIFPTSFGWVDQQSLAPSTLANYRQNSFEFFPKPEDYLNHNNNGNSSIYPNLPVLSNQLSHEQSMDSNTTSDGDEMPSLSPVPVELPSPSHLPIGRLSRFLSHGAQVHTLERQAEEIKHNQQQFLKHHGELDAMEFDLPSSSKPPYYPRQAQGLNSGFGQRKRKADEFPYESDGEDSLAQTSVSNNSLQSDTEDSENWVAHHQAGSPSLAHYNLLSNTQSYDSTGFTPSYSALFDDLSSNPHNPISSFPTTQPKPKKPRKDKADNKDGVASKDRHVKSALKLNTGGELQETVIVDVIPVHYNPPNEKPHKVRLIQVTNIPEQTIRLFAHGADVGGVVERKSNISRLFGKFESPSEKLLMNVIGSHNHRIGQESNILTERGVKRFLSVNKMRGQEHYKTWLQKVLIPRLHEGNQQIFDPNNIQRHPDAEKAEPKERERSSRPSSTTSTPSLYSSSPASVESGPSYNPLPAAMIPHNMNQVYPAPITPTVPSLYHASSQ
jgi:hypothetical protein